MWKGMDVIRSSIISMRRCAAARPILPCHALSHPSLVTSCVQELLYDKVLVDAECTHDGSIKHLAKFEKWGCE